MEQKTEIASNVFWVLCLLTFIYMLKHLTTPHLCAMICFRMAWAERLLLDNLLSHLTDIIVCLMTSRALCRFLQCFRVLSKKCVWVALRLIQFHFSLYLAARSLTSSYRYLDWPTLGKCRPIRLWRAFSKCVVRDADLWRVKVELEKDLCKGDFRQILSSWEVD